MRFARHTRKRMEQMGLDEAKGRRDDGGPDFEITLAS